MATKEQERKALEQIKAIVAKLGEDSYIGTAFEGCFEIAEDNIDNDFMCSMKQRVDRACAEADKARDDANGLCMAHEAATRNLMDATQKLTDANNALSGLQEKYDDLQYRYVEHAQAAIAKEQELQEQLDAAQMEIIKLKARLYDYMTA